MAGKRKKLTKVQLKDLKQSMKEQLNKLIFKGVIVSDEFNLKDEDRSDSVDMANAAVLSNHNLRFRNRELFYRKKLEEAIERLDAENYGICEECDEQIGYHRLIARPTADMCIMCKEDAERDESISFTGRKSKSLGEPIGVRAQAR